MRKLRNHNTYMMNYVEVKSTGSLYPFSASNTCRIRKLLSTEGHSLITYASKFYFYAPSPQMYVKMYEMSKSIKRTRKAYTGVNEYVKSEIPIAQCFSEFKYDTFSFIMYNF